MTERKLQKMKEKKENTEQRKLNRKDFLKESLVFGFAAFAVAGIGKLFKKIKGDGKKVTVLMPDGKVAEIDKSKIPQYQSSARASDDEIWEWMNKKNNHTNAP